MFEGVRILVVDEVSFLRDLELDKMMKHLQNLGDSHLPFGGYNIVSPFEATLRESCERPNPLDLRLLGDGFHIRA